MTKTSSSRHQTERRQYVPCSPSVRRAVCGLLCAAVMCALLLGGMTGCSKNTRSAQKQLFDKGILTENNLTYQVLSRVQDEEADEEDYKSAEYIEIDGLQDEAVERKINARIIETLDRMWGEEYVPPYRGISLKLREWEGCEKDIHIDMYVDCNCNNILSIDAYAEVDYRAYDTDGEYLGSFDYRYELPLNFDLTTGEELTLRDIFAPDADYIELLNRAIDQKLLQDNDDAETMLAFSENMLTAPFQGIRPEQKFSIAENGDLWLYFDYDTPEFYTAFRPIMVRISPKDVGHALEPFRISDKPLYEYSETRYILTEDIEQSKYFGRSVEWKENVSFDGEYTYADNLPEAVKQQIDALTFDEACLPFSHDDIYGQMAERYGDTNWRMHIDCCTYYLSFTAGEYFNLSRYYNVYVQTKDEGEQEETETEKLSYDTNYCLDREGHVVELSSLFVHPQQASACIRQVMIANLMREEGTDEAAAETYVDELLPHINGVNIWDEYLLISFDLSGQELVSMTQAAFGDVDLIPSYTHTVSELYYQDIGFQNLKIFR